MYQAITTKEESSIKRMNNAEKQRPIGERESVDTSGCTANGTQTDMQLLARYLMLYGMAGWFACHVKYVASRSRRRTTTITASRLMFGGCVSNTIEKWSMAKA